MAPAVCASVIGRLLSAQKAILPGFARYRVQDRMFPGIIEDPSRATHGILYTGLTSRDWRRLDAFEGDFYDRRLVSVDTGRGRRADAYTYVVADRFRRVLGDEPWDPEQFRQGDFFAYLNRIRTR